MSNFIFNQINQNWKHNYTLKVVLRQVKSYFEVDFKEINQEELLRPLVSGLAARIWLHITEQDIPVINRTFKQGELWKQYYDRGDSNVTEDDFFKELFYFEHRVPPTCSGKMDLAIIVDASGSIRKHNYEKAKLFVSDLVSKFSLNSSKIGMVIFSSWSETIFNLNSNFNLVQLQDKISSSRYPGYATFLELGLEDAIKILFAVTKRVGVPKIMAIFTDGQPNGNSQRLDRVLADARTKNVTIFAYGIGPYIKNDTLLYLTASSDHIFWIESYNALRESAAKINIESCKVPQNPPPGVPVPNHLKEGETRYFELEADRKGLRVKVDTKLGETKGFFSFSNKNPSISSNDGQFRDEAVIVPRLQSSEISDLSPKSRVYVAVQGREPENEFSFLSGQIEQWTTPEEPYK